MKTETKPKSSRMHPRVQFHFTQSSMTKQSFKDECNINKIMAKYQKSGAITHFSNNSPQYGDATSAQLHDAMNIVADANSMFEELPSSLRKKFHNDPAEFLDFVQNEDNLAEMRELGLATGSNSDDQEHEPTQSDTGDRSTTEPTEPTEA